MQTTDLRTMSVRAERLPRVTTRAVASWHERRSCCQLTAAASHHPSSSMCLVSLRRLSRLLAAARAVSPRHWDGCCRGARSPAPVFPGGIGLCQTQTCMRPRQRQGQLPTQTAPKTKTETQRDARGRATAREPFPTCAGARLSGVSL